MGWLDRIRSLFGKPAPEVDDSAPGWDAIDAALYPVYGNQEPQHWGTIHRWILGGPDPLDGVSAYRAQGPPSHWHYVSYGLSELYDKGADNDPNVSGWGFELTFRVLRDASEEQAPVWAINFLQNVARYVFKSGNAFGAGHTMDANGPLQRGAISDVTALLFVHDPQLPPIDTPHGRLQFLQVVGLTRDEYNACRTWEAHSFAAVLARDNPLLVTDLGRKSILADDAVRREVEKGQARDGSSSAGAHVDKLSWRTEEPRVIVTIGAHPARSLPLYVRGRLLHDRPFTLYASEQAVTLTRGAANTVTSDDSFLNVALTDAAIAAMVEIFDAPQGRYDIPGTDVTIEIVRSQILNHDGSVVEEIG